MSSSATKKCDPTRCICTPEAYIEAFLKTPNLSGNETTNPDLATAVIPGPVCVGENLVARINGNGIPPLTPTLSALGMYSYNFTPFYKGY